MTRSSLRPTSLVFAALIALLLLVPGPLRPAAFAQPLADGPSTPGAELTIYHVTMGPGDMVWEKFEHNALWVHDPVRGTDRVYNYGMFDFDQPGYWRRFIRGDWLYWVDDTADIYRTVFVYREYLNRTVSVQELNLTPAQRARLRDFLEWNAHEDNRFYYYDYFYDNCSTRIRDAIDFALDGALGAATRDSLTGTTFRWHSERLVADDPAVFTGLLVGLGPGADREIDAWEEMFLPGKVQEQLRRLQVPDGRGGTVPLVAEERVLYTAVGRDPVREAPPDWRARYLLAGLLIGGTLAGLARLAPRSGPARYGFAALSALWAAFAGTAGLLLAFLWAFTNHEIAHRNENLLQLSPLLLPLVVLVPALAFGVRWAARPATALVLALVAMSIVGLLLGPLPALAQSNLALIALALPANLGLAAATLMLARAPDPAPPRAPARRPRSARRGGGVAAR